MFIQARFPRSRSALALLKTNSSDLRISVSLQPAHYFNYNESEDVKVTGAILSFAAIVKIRFLPTPGQFSADAFTSGFSV